MPDTVRPLRRDSTIHIDVPGMPVPQGSKSLDRFGRMYEANPKLSAWRDTIVFFTRRHGFGGLFTSGPLAVEAIFCLRKPARCPRDLPHVKPDLDKLQRALGDALTQSGLIGDDAQIVTWIAHKLYAGDSGALDQPGVCLTVGPALLPVTHHTKEMTA